MGIGGFLGNVEHEAGEDNVVTFPKAKVVVQESNQETVEGHTNVIALHTETSVDQLKNIRGRRELDRENDKLAQLRVKRLEELKRIFVEEPLKLKGIEEIETIEAELACENLDTLKGQTLQYKKSMVAVYYGLPVEYIQADASSANIESLNLTIKSVSRVVAQLPADSDEARDQLRQLDELKSLKTSLYDEMNNADRVLMTRKGLITIITGVARIIRGVK